jgi:hypothetical protein
MNPPNPTSFPVGDACVWLPGILLLLPLHLLLNLLLPLHCLDPVELLLLPLRPINLLELPVVLTRAEPNVLSQQ